MLNVINPFPPGPSLNAGTVKKNYTFSCPNGTHRDETVMGRKDGQVGRGGAGSNTPGLRKLTTIQFKKQTSAEGLP